MPTPVTLGALATAVVEPAHLAGLWRVTTPLEPVDGALSAFGRSLADYDAVVGGLR